LQVSAAGDATVVEVASEAARAAGVQVSGATMATMAPL
jgi:hypothetical protein